MAPINFAVSSAGSSTPHASEGAFANSFRQCVGSATIQVAARSMNTGTHTRRGGQQGRSTISRVSRDTVGSFFATAPISLDSLDPMMIFRSAGETQFHPDLCVLLNTEKARACGRWTRARESILPCGAGYPVLVLATKRHMRARPVPRRRPTYKVSSSLVA